MPGQGIHLDIISTLLWKMCFCRINVISYQLVLFPFVLEIGKLCGLIVGRVASLAHAMQFINSYLILLLIKVLVIMF